MRALITGASYGIGGATCLKLAKDALAKGEPAKIVASSTGLRPDLLELIAELKRRHPQVRIVIASGQSREGRLRSGVTEDDSVLVLEKPFLSRDLKHALDRALRSDPASSQPA